MTVRFPAVALALLLAACHDEAKAPLPPPQALSDSAVAQFCGMDITEHPGPKGQIFLRGNSQPFWFASARDAIGFTLLGEMPKNIAVIYVTDMARTSNWDHPGPDAWVNAHKALYVIDSRRRGGMGAAEAVPFSDPAVAQQFAAANGGRVVDFAHIPQTYILGSDGDGS